MNLISWESLLPIKDIFGEDLPELNMTGIDLATDVYQTAEGVTVEMQLPGIKLDAYDVKVRDGMLVVSGKRDKTTEVEDKNYYHKEIQRGSFERRVKLPDVALKTDALRPDIADGTLKLFIPKA
ncbi:MAG: Hsp20/alpha crystallin family protein [Patescibacteria group bacterium]|jgi:HSP20 family protein